MDKVIESNVIKDYLFNKFKISFEKEIDALPSANVQINKIARWQRKVIHQPRWQGKVQTTIYHVCSGCLSAYDRTPNRCPVCDAWMKGGEKE